MGVDRPDTPTGARPTVASACGKLILIGEHSVVYGEPALAVPLPSMRLVVRLDPADREEVDLEEVAPAAAREDVLRALRTSAEALGLPCPVSIRLTVRTGGLRSGMGTSAALGVALARAVLAWHGEPTDDGRVLAAAEAVEKLFHGTPSGIDHTVSALEAPLWFVRGRLPQVLVDLKPLVLVLLRRRSSASTGAIVGGVRDRLEADSTLAGTVLEMGDAARAARSAWERGDLVALTDALQAQQDGLDRLGVVNASDRAAIAAAMDAGALVAKVTGAGWGGSLLALVDNAGRAEAVRAAWGDDALIC